MSPRPESLGPMTPLRRLCIRKGLSRAGLAKAAGLSRQTIYNIDGGHDFPSDESLFKLATALGVDPLFLADVLTGAVDPDSAPAVAA